MINVNHGYVHAPDATEWIPGIFELVATAQRMGYVTIVVTNQAGIGRGYYDEAMFLDFTAWMHREFAGRGCPLLATYWCPHHPDAGVEAYGVKCACRKPAPGMLQAASRQFDLDLRRSLMVGDSASDMDAAHVSGVGFRILLRASGQPCVVSDHTALVNSLADAQDVLQSFGAEEACSDA